MYAWESTHHDVLGEKRALLHAQELGAGSKGIVWMMCQLGVPEQLAQHILGRFTTGKLSEVRIKLRSLFDGGEGFDAGFQLRDGFRGALFVGKPTTGKSAISAAFLRACVLSGFTARFMTIEEFARFHTTWIELSKNADKYDDYADRAGGWRRELWRMERVFEFLVVDDICRAKVPEFVLEELHNLIRSRTAHGCFTILTSNEDMAETTARFGNPFREFVKREFYTAAFTDKDVLNMEEVRA